MNQILLSDLRKLSYRLQQGVIGDKENILYIKRALALITCTGYALHHQRLKLEKSKFDDGRTLILQTFDMLIASYSTSIGQSEKIGFRISNVSRYVSPYLSDGMAGVLACSIYLSRWLETSKYNDLMEEWGDSLAKVYLPQSVTLYRGLSGIIWAVLLFKDYKKSGKYDHWISKSCLDIGEYLLKYKQNLYVVNESFQLLDSSFKHGNRGVSFLLKELLEANLCDYLE